MKSSSISSSVSTYPCKVSKRRVDTVRPPIPPKPDLSKRYENYSGCGSNLLIGDLVTNDISNLNTLPSYSSYPSAVLIKDEDLSQPVNSISNYEKVKFYEQNGFDSASPLSPPYIEQALRPLTKAEIIPNSVSHPHVQPNEAKHDKFIDEKASRASAKNALLMEKIGASNIHNKTGIRVLPRAHSEPMYCSSVSINKCDVIPVNRFEYSAISNGVDDIDSIKLNDQRRSLNLDSSKLYFIINSKQLSSPSKSSISREALQTERELLPEISSDICYKCNQYKTRCTCGDPGKSEMLIDKKNDGTFYSAEIVIGKENDDVFGENPDTFQQKSSFITSKDLEIVNFPCDSNSIKVDNCSQILGTHSAPSTPAAKPPLIKGEAFDKGSYEYYKRLSRGISRATDNVNIVLKAQSEIAQGIWDTLENCHSNNSNSPFFVETPVNTFILPDLSSYSDDFRTFLEKDLIEMSTLLSLEGAGRLNWWYIIGALQRLWPLATTGDGNCLLHAASLGMWGFHDRLLTLRKALHEFLTRSMFCRPLWRRWRWQSAVQNRETGLVLSSEEWEAEWESVLQLASSAPRGTPHCQNGVMNSTPDLHNAEDSKAKSDGSCPVYESLEEIHVFALAHVLRRPIIVMADTTLKDMNGDPLAPISFGGIYLPLECPPCECQKSPLILTYDAAHFSALVTMEMPENSNGETLEQILPAVIPVTDCHHQLLPLQFVIDPGEGFPWGKEELCDEQIERFTLDDGEKKCILSSYLDLIEVPIPSSYLASNGISRQEDQVQYADQNLDRLELDKKLTDFSFDSDEGPSYSDSGVPGSNTGKNRNSTQLHTVVKSFGSIGRNMSRRIKKNLNNLSKFSRSNSFRKKNNCSTKNDFDINGLRISKDVSVSLHQSYILGASIHTDKRHPFQQEMIENYLTTARERFMKTNQSKTFPRVPARNTDSCTTSVSSGVVDHSFDTVDTRLVHCINTGCEMYGTSQTSYMCSSCYNRQKEREEKEYSRKSVEDPKPLPNIPSEYPNNGLGLQYGTGKSKFYAALDENSVKNATLIPVTNIGIVNSKDKTVFLSNSTFYNDSHSSGIPSYNLTREFSKAKPNNSRSSSSDSLATRPNPKSSAPCEVIRPNLKSQNFVSKTKISSNRISLTPVNTNDLIEVDKGCRPVGDLEVDKNGRTITDLEIRGKNCKSITEPERGGKSNRPINDVETRSKNCRPITDVETGSKNCRPISDFEREGKNSKPISDFERLDKTGRPFSDFEVDKNCRSINARPNITTVRPFSEGGNPYPNAPSGDFESFSTGSETPKPCISKGCSFFGNPITKFYCSKCYLANKNTVSYNQTSSKPYSNHVDI